MKKLLFTNLTKVKTKKKKDPKVQLNKDLQGVSTNTKKRKKRRIVSI